MEEFLLEIAGSKLLLLADKALYWPQRRVLCVADPHFGKATVYRALGQPVPHGTTAANLLRLDKLLARYPADQLIFLGDFLHGPKSHAPATLTALREWRLSHHKLTCILIRGNHDLRAGDPPADLDIQIADEPLLLEPFALRHTPALHADYHVIAGHTHPVFQLQGKGHQRLRLPCFQSTHQITVLPSFGDFTGGYRIDADAGRRIFVTNGSRIWPIPSTDINNQGSAE